MPDDLDMANNNTEKTENDEQIGDPKKINFSNTLEVILAIQNKQKQIITNFFEELSNGNYIELPNFDFNNQDDVNLMENFIVDPLNKNLVLDTYLKLLRDTPVGDQNNSESKVLELVQHCYTCDEIKSYELENYLNNLINVGRGIFGGNWNGENISLNQISHFPYLEVATPEEFVDAFNKKNSERKTKNIEEIKKIQELNIKGLDFHKNARVIYLNGLKLDGNSILDNQDIQLAFYKQLHDNTEYDDASFSEFVNDLSKVSSETKDSIYKDIYEKIDEENENYLLHESGLKYYKEYKLADKKDILSAFENGDYEMLEKKHNKLQEIMNLLEIQEDDIPDLREEKARLIYLLNHGLFRSFQLEVGAIPSNLSMFDNKAVLGESTLKALEDHLKRYKTEKSPEFFKLIEDIKKIDVDIDGALQNASIKKELNNETKKGNIKFVVEMFKNVFIQRLKNGACNVRDITTFKYQIAYILATMHHECRYMHDSHNDLYRGFGQIYKGYTGFWTQFIQGSGLELNSKNSKDIKLSTPYDFLDRDISRFTFVYGLSYGLFSSGGNLDRWINDSKKDYIGARKIEAGKYAETIANIARIWEKYVK